MANYFAIANGNWSANSTWDSNIIPTSADVVYTNGYTVTIDTDVDVDRLINGSNAGQLPNMCVPAMTSNTAPSGVASASSNNSLAYLAFDGNPNTYYDAGGSTVSPGTPFTLTYQFATPKIIKRFRIVSAYNSTPNAFTIQASDDPTFATFATLVTGNMPNTGYNIFISASLTNTTAYTYYRLNVTTSLLNVSTPKVYAFDMTESSSVITNGSGTSANTLIQTGGYYNIATLPTLPAERTVVVRNTVSGIVNQSSQVVINATAPTGILNINHFTNGNLIGGDNAGWQPSYSFIQLTSAFTATLNVRGNIIGQTAGWSNRDNAGISIAGSCTCNYIGNITAGYGDINAIGNVGILLTSTATLAIVNITGNLLGQQVLLSTNPGGAAIWSNSTGLSTINVTGNITGYLYPAIQVASTSNTSVNVITGTVTASNTNVGLRNLGGGTVTLLSPVMNSNNVVGVLSPRIKFYPTGISQWRFQNQTGANVTIYSGAGAGDGYPAEDTVRYGSPTYGPTNSEYNGTMRIPDVTNVNKGVEYGYGLVGTGQLTAEAFLDAISTSTNPMAIRLKNLSTTQTMGDQLSGFSNA